MRMDRDRGWIRERIRCCSSYNVETFSALPNHMSCTPLAASMGWIDNRRGRGKEALFGKAISWVNPLALIFCTHATPPLSHETADLPGDATGGHPGGGRRNPEMIRGDMIKKRRVITWVSQIERKTVGDVPFPNSAKASYYPVPGRGAYTSPCFFFEPRTGEPHTVSRRESSLQGRLSQLKNRNPCNAPCRPV
jgi:hypothetical protein